MTRLATSAELPARLAAFVARWNGHELDVDHAFGGQCVDVVKGWCDALGLPELFGNAAEEFGRDAAHWQWVRNNPRDLAQIPPRGAVIIWGPASGVADSKYGHCAVVLASDRAGFTSFDQNWPRGAKCHPVRHTYRGILGWGLARLPAPKPAPAPVVTPPAPPAPTPAPGPAPVEVPPVPPPVNPTPSAPPLPVDPSEPVEIPEPAIVAEAGITTSEWKLAVRYLVQLAGVGTAAAVDRIAQATLHAGLTIPPDTLDLIVKFEIAGAVAVVGYVLSRGVRKLFATS